MRPKSNVRPVIEAPKLSKKGRSSMHLIAVGVAVVFILLYTIPVIQHAAAVDRCLDQGGRFDYDQEVCVTD